MSGIAQEVVLQDEVLIRCCMLAVLSFQMMVVNMLLSLELGYILSI
jgi:hypothetical protein